MYDVIFYSDSKGDEPVAEYIGKLRQKSYTDKNARINFNKIVAYIDILCEKGTRVGEPVIKHLIWKGTVYNGDQLERFSEKLKSNA